MRIDGIKQGECEMRVYLFKNLGYQLMAHHGGPYFECQSCGITTKIKHPDIGRKPKYCSVCAAKIHTQQRINSVITCRNKLKECKC